MQSVHRGMAVLASVGLAAVLICGTADAVSTAVPAPTNPPFRESNYYTPRYRSAQEPERTWDYADFKTWPELCHNGRRQSPLSFVNVDPAEVVTDANLRRLRFSPACTFHKDRTKMEIVNDGNTLRAMFETESIVPGDPSPCTVTDPIASNVTYHFLGLHFHANSEHKFRSIAPDVEMHLVFGAGDPDEGKQLLQIAILLKASSTINSTSVRALRHMLVEGSLPLPFTKTTCFLTEDLPVLSFLPNEDNYLVYDGSNTRPPCRENVRWVVMTSPVLISRLALGKLRNAMDETMPNAFHRYGNARPPQPLNNRRIYRFTDGDKKYRNEGEVKDVWRRHDNVTASLLTAADIKAWSLAMNDTTAESEAASNSDPSEVDTAAHDDSVSDPVKDSDAAVRGSSDDWNCSGDGDEAILVHERLSTGPNGSAHLPTPPASATELSPRETEALLAEEATVTPQPEVSAALKASSKAKNLDKPTTAPTTTTATSKAPSKGHPKSTAGAGDKRSWSDRGRAATDKTVAYARTALEYAKAHPTNIAVFAILILLTLFTIVSSCRAWLRPAYVVGVSPDELEPLTDRGRRGGYGTNASV